MGYYRHHQSSYVDEISASNDLWPTDWSTLSDVTQQEWGVKYFCIKWDGISRAVNAMLLSSQYKKQRLVSIFQYSL